MLLKLPYIYNLHLLFLYADIFPSQFEPLFGLPRDMILGGMFLKPFKKTRSSCFIGFKNTRLGLVFLNPIKFFNITYNAIERDL